MRVLSYFFIVSTLILNRVQSNVISSVNYDYIIVGAGAAGSVVASELSKDPTNKVLLIEEGGFSSSWGDIIDDASNYWKVLNNSQIERGYFSTPQKNVNDREIPLYRAKVTGGCGSHYGMCWTLGNKKDFDSRWDVDNWRWNDLSKHWDYIQQTFEINTIKYDEFTDRFFAAAKENGYEYNPNYNDLNDDKGQYGASQFQYSVALKTNKNNEVYASRETSWTQYIEPIMSERNNLDIIVYNRANKILFNDDPETMKSVKPKAVGIETTHVVTHRNYTFYASKEVIISGGTFDTPKLLLLSGIGDCNKYNLKPCVVDLKSVGKLLTEHIYFLVESPPLKKDHLLVTNVTLPPFIYATDFRVIMYDEDNEFEFIFIVDSKHKMNLKYVESLDKTSKQKAETIQIFVLPTHLKSRGYVSLRDNNPASDPLIELNFLSNKYDEEYLIKAVKKARKLLYSQSLIDLYENIDDEVLPGSNIKTDKQILEWTKTVLLSDYHATGTCRIGGVVDNTLKVKGIENLRIVDAAIMPDIVSAHIYAATMLISFRASELILKDNIHKKTEL